MMRVSRDAEAKNHHPEWSITNGGKILNVKLTSHFADNAVTRLDFEMAEAMNMAFEETKISFRLHPRFTRQTHASIKIGLGLSLILLISLKFANFPWYKAVKEKRVVKTAEEIALDEESWYMEKFSL